MPVELEALEEMQESTSISSLDSSSSPAIAVAMFTLLLACQLWLLLYHFHTMLVPYYPVCFDQVVFFACVYKCHFTLQQNPLSLQDSWHVISDTYAMKGCLLQILGVLFSFFTGAQRSICAYTNFFFLASAQAALVVFVWRRQGLHAALWSLGLFLLCYATHYLPAGALDDFRLDYGAVCMMGLFSMALLRYVEKGSVKTFALCAISLVLLAFTRSVSLIYLAAALPLAVLIMSCEALLRRAPQDRTALLRLAILWALDCTVAGVYFLAFWSQFSAYYLQYKQSGLAAMSQRISGVHDLASSLVFYLYASLGHFLLVFLITAAFMARVFFIRVKTGEKAAWTIENRRSICLSASYAAALLVSVLAFGAYFGPNPFTPGIAAIPICLFGGDIFAVFIKRYLSARTIGWGSCLCLAMGLGLFTVSMLAPFPPRFVDLALAKNCNSIFEHTATAIESSRQNPVRVLWLLVHDGLSAAGFQIYWCEQRQRLLPPNVVPMNLLPCPETPTNELVKLVDNADIVVVPTKIAQLSVQETFDGTRSVQKSLPALIPKLENDFELLYTTDVAVASFSAKKISIGVFRRKILTMKH